MARYYLDMRDDEGWFFDETGIDFATIEAAKTEAARALYQSSE
jgi:hypothetical protein